jgi:hypothetical protein
MCFGREREKTSMKTCSISNCDRPYAAKGLCMFHYKRARFNRELTKPPRHNILPKDHPVYIAWTNMKTRCDNQNSTQYKWYGGRGITYCVAWKDFEHFYSDMFSGWQEGLTLDRRGTNGNYNKDNCRWATHQEQAGNRNERGYLDAQ